MQPPITPDITLMGRFEGRYGRFERVWPGKNVNDPHVYVNTAYIVGRGISKGSCGVE